MPVARRVIACAAALAAVAALAALATTSAPARARRGCPPSHTTLVQQNRVAKVYDRRVSGDRYFGVCRRRSRARIFLAFDGLDVEGLAAVVSYMRLRSTHLATVEGYAGDVNPGQFWVRVYDVTKSRRIPKDSPGRDVGFRRAAKRVRSASAYRGARYNRVRSFVLGPAATACWIAEALDSRVFQVHCLNRTGDRVLDEDPAIVGSSLALDGHTLSWQRADVIRTAEI
jgi:hypothetical protein